MVCQGGYLLNFAPLNDMARSSDDLEQDSLNYYSHRVVNRWENYNNLIPPHLLLLLKWFGCYEVHNY